jgi:hypothetical protein
LAKIGTSSKWTRIAVFLAQTALFSVIARYRLVDGDEGFYLRTS